jgi:hypothetical protein
MATAAKKITTNPEKGSVVQVTHNRKVRLLLWGGAYATSDNYTFERAKINVVKTYKVADRSKYDIVVKQINSADQLIAAINAQKAESIRSLDIFTHGGPDDFYMVSVRSDKDGGLNDLRLYRYAFHNESFSRGDLKKLQFDRFTVDAKVELHGCKTAEESSVEDNIAADFSKHLYEAGKTRSSVVGHTENATPAYNGGGKTKDEDQDYRHGKRAIFKNGKLIKNTSQKGMLDEAELAK